jgi:NAD(P)-dependent dehydrogenase (short-subunit alcohol dehydrogenase family)
MRLQGKIAIVIGAGQSAGSTAAIGNGRATAIVFAREGARVLAVDRDLASAEDTVKLIAEAGGEAIAYAADVVDEAQVKAAINTCIQHWGRIDILHNNVGISVAGHDASVEDITTAAFDRLVAVNLRGMVYS